jgi:hypothetical protein
LAGPDADLDFGLVQPASVSGRVVDSEAVLDFTSDLVAEQAGEGFAAMKC